MLGLVLTTLILAKVNRVVLGVTTELVILMGLVGHF